MDYNNTKMPINNESDLIHARLRVRETARRIGMTLMDQSRISMATSSLANALGLGLSKRSSGFVTIEKVVNQARIGLRVTCSRKNNVVSHRPSPIVSMAFLFYSS